MDPICRAMRAAARAAAIRMFCVVTSKADGATDVARRRGYVYLSLFDADPRAVGVAGPEAVEEMRRVG